MNATMLARSFALAGVAMFLGTVSGLADGEHCRQVGEMFSPTQFGLLCLSLQAFFVASVPLSWIAGEVNVFLQGPNSLR